MKKQEKTFNDYLLEVKSDMILYFVILAILMVALVILDMLYGIKGAICSLFLVLAHLIFTLDKVTSYRNILKIEKYLIDNKLENKIGNILFWNEKNYFLTDNFMIIIKKKEVNCFSYQDIKSISKRVDVEISKHSGMQEYLTIELKNNKKYEVLTLSTYLVGEEYKDISDILLDKNSDIYVINKEEK